MWLCSNWMVAFLSLDALLAVDSKRKGLVTLQLFSCHHSRNQWDLQLFVDCIRCHGVSITSQPVSRMSASYYLKVQLISCRVIPSSFYKGCGLQDKPTLNWGSGWHKTSLLSLIGASLSEPHTSGTLLRTCVWMFACLLACNHIP